MKTYKWFRTLIGASLLVPALVLGQSTGKRPDTTSRAVQHEDAAPATSNAPSHCSASTSGLSTNLECNADATSAATHLAAQLLGAYKHPTEKPDLSGEYGVVNIGILAALGNKSENAKKATLTAEGTTAQTNKQIGAPASSNGSTSAVEKVGVPQLLAVAVENGAITNNVTGNTMTLSTSAYGFVAGFLRDTQAAYSKCGPCTLFGASATFNLTNTSDPLQNASRKQVSQWQVKYTFKDTSIRSKKVVTIYEGDQGLATYALKLARDLSNKVNTKKVMTDLNAALGSAVKNAEASQALQDLLKSQVAPGASAPNGAAGTGSNSGGATGGGASTDTLSQIATQILKDLDSDADYQKALIVAANDPEVRDVVAQYAADLKAYVEADKAFEAAVRNLQKGFNGDLTFGQQFPTVAASTSKTSTTAAMPAYLVGGLDLTWQPRTSVPKGGSTAPLKLSPWPSATANFASSFYTNPDPALNEKTFRGGTAALQLQWSLGQGPFIKSATDKSQVTVSLSGKYQRLQENKHVAGKKADITLGNVKVEIPISSGISFPISVTFANSSEQIKETYVRGNFGISFDLDKLASVLNAK